MGPTVGSASGLPVRFLVSRKWALLGSLRSYSYQVVWRFTARMLLPTKMWYLPSRGTSKTTQ